MPVKIRVTAVMERSRSRPQGIRGRESLLEGFPVRPSPTVFDHPRDVLDDQRLSLGEKRAILASWASDAAAVASCPALRAPAGLKKPVTIDDILEALYALDGPGNPPNNPPGGKPNRLRSVSRLLAA